MRVVGWVGTQSHYKTDGDAFRDNGNKQGNRQQEPHATYNVLDNPLVSHSVLTHGMRISDAVLVMDLDMTGRHHDIGLTGANTQEPNGEHEESGAYSGHSLRGIRKHSGGVSEITGFRSIQI